MSLHKHKSVVRLEIEYADLDNDDATAAIIQAVKMAAADRFTIDVQYRFNGHAVVPSTLCGTSTPLKFYASRCADATQLGVAQLPWRLSQAFHLAGLLAPDGSWTGVYQEALAAFQRASLFLDRTVKEPPALTAKCWYAVVTMRDGSRTRWVPALSIPTARIERPVDAPVTAAEMAACHTLWLDLHRWIMPILDTTSFKAVELVEHKVEAPISFLEWAASVTPLV